MTLWSLSPGCSFTIEVAPLSTNMAYKLTSRGGFARMYLSKAAQDFKGLCSFSALAARPNKWPLGERYYVGLDFYFRDQRPDSDGPLKLVLDALQGCLYNNDRQIDEVRYRRLIDAARPRVEAIVSVRTKMSEIRESVEELATRLAIAVAELVTHRIKDTLTTSLVTVVDGPAIAKPLAPVVPAKPRGRRPTPPELQKLCARADGKPVLAKGLCRKHYYEMRRKVKEATGNGSAAAAAT